MMLRTYLTENLWTNSSLANFSSPVLVNALVTVDKKTDLITNVHLKLGNNYLGLRKSLVKKSLHDAANIIGQSCPSCSISHEVGFWESVENALGIDHLVPLYGRLGRIIFLEWARIGSHLTYIRDVLYNSNAISLVNRMRTLFVHYYNFLPTFTGKKNFLLSELFSLGGISICPTLPSQIYSANWVALFDNYWNSFKKKLQYEKSLNYLQGLGTINTLTATKYNPVGIAARAAGLPQDVRIDNPMHGYEKLHIRDITLFSHKYDLLDFFLYHVDEVQQSLTIMDEILNNHYLGAEPFIIDIDHLPKEPSEGWSRIESPHGETNYYIKLDENHFIKDFVWQSPSLVNWPLFKFRVRYMPYQWFSRLFGASNFCFYCAEE